MKRLISVFVAASLSIVGLSASANDGFTYTNVATPALAPTGLTVTVNSLQLLDKPGSTQLVISYTQKNNTADKKLDEGSFKLFFTDGSSEPQYGGFNSFFPGDGNTRSYTWEWLKGKEPWLIEWEAGFFAAKPTPNGLKWKVGASFPTPTPSGSSGESANSRVREVKFSAPSSALPGTSLRIAFTFLDTSGRPVTDELVTLSISGPGFFTNGGQQKPNADGVVTALVLLGSGDSGLVSVTANAGGTKATATVLVSAITTPPAVKPVKYKNCTELNKVYPGGVAKSAISKNKGGKIRLVQEVNAKVYDLNKSLDRDKDGLACER